MTKSQPPVTAWRKSTYSGSSDNCVEVAALNRAIVIRDSNDPGGPMLSITTNDWSGFIRKVRLGKANLI